MTSARASGRPEHFERLREVIEGLADQTSIDGAARVVARAGADAAGACAAMVYLVEPDHTARLVASVGTPDEIQASRASISLDAPLPLTFVMRTGTELFASSREELARSYPASTIASMPELAWQAVAALPLKLRTRVIGGLALVYREPHDFSLEERQFLGALGTLAALAMERARLHEGEAETRARLERLTVELQDALQLRDEFLSIASHELNTPLTALQLNIQSLQRRLARGDALDVPAVEKVLAPVTRQLGRMAKLLRNLLDVSRIATHALRLDIEAFDLCEMVRETVERLAPVAAEQGVKLELDTECDALTGYWDRLRLEQIISNLVANAVKYGQQRPVRIHVARQGELATVSVADQGIGIPQEALGRIFERFQRATPTHKTDSFGLGLYISKQIAAAHGGVIEVHSTVGQGSTFTLKVPVHPVFQELEGPP